MNDYCREIELKDTLNVFLQQITNSSEDFKQKMDLRCMLSLKNVLSNVNNLMTLQVTLAFVEFLRKHHLIGDTQVANMINEIQSQHSNTNGYDIEYDNNDGVPIVAEIKCNIPVKGDDFGSAQKNGIKKDIKGLFEGKKKAPLKINAYKFMVILNTDDVSDKNDTQKAIDKLLSKLNANSTMAICLSVDKSNINIGDLDKNMVYVINLKL